MLIYLLRLFNEAILRPAWAILDICWRLPYALYHGFRAGAVEAGLEIIPASILSGFVIARWIMPSSVAPPWSPGVFE
jgi:hypothetical protein